MGEAVGAAAGQGFRSWGALRRIRGNDKPMLGARWNGWLFFGVKNRKAPA
jgi:hypothetical protein